MPIDSNRIKERDVEASFVGPIWCFPAVQSDTDYIVDPNDPSVPLVSAAISLSAAGAIKIEHWNGRIATIPSGALQAGVRYPMHIAKVWATGTDALEVIIWRGFACLDIKPSTY